MDESLLENPDDKNLPGEYKSPNEGKKSDESNNSPDPSKALTSRRIERHLRKAEINKELDDLLRRTYEPIENKGSDESLDRLNLLKQILGPGGVLLLDDPQSYIPRIKKEYYKEMRRLCGIDPESDFKPKMFGHYTNLLIYKRFPAGTLPSLRLKNPKNEDGVREFYFHQFLSPQGVFNLLTFVDDAIKGMKQHTNMQHFLHDYCKEYKIPYQTTLFDRSDKDSQSNPIK